LDVDYDFVEQPMKQAHQLFTSKMVFKLIDPQSIEEQV